MQAKTIELFDSSAVMLSRAAADWLGVKAGDTLRVYVGTSAIELKVIGVLPAGAYRQRLGIMDIAAAQWRLQQLGRLNRIDLRLRPGVDVAPSSANWPHGCRPACMRQPRQPRPRAAPACRLPTVSTSTCWRWSPCSPAHSWYFPRRCCSSLRRRSQFALLRVVGLTRTRLIRLLVAEGAVIGAAGATLGVVLGYALAALALKRFGGDLGAGYFNTLSPALHVTPAALAAFWLLGVAFADTRRRGIRDGNRPARAGAGAAGPVMKKKSLKNNALHGQAQR